VRGLLSQQECYSRAQGPVLPWCRAPRCKEREQTGSQDEQLLQMCCFLLPTPLVWDPCAPGVEPHKLQPVVDPISDKETGHADTHQLGQSPE
jgi:hypothetical protein